MPKVGSKKFPYTPAGIERAETAAEKSGKKMMVSKAHKAEMNLMRKGMKKGK